jgi:putative sterol carrier protein
MRFLSKEWVDHLAEQLKQDEKYQKKTKGFDSYYQLIAEPNPARGITERRAAGLLLPQATETWEGIRENVDYTMTAPYEIFYKIFTGQLGAILAITSGKAKVTGNYAKMMRYTAGANMFVQNMKKMPTDFEGDFQK